MRPPEAAGAACPHAGELPFQVALRERCARPRAVPLLLAANVVVFGVMLFAGAGLLQVDPSVHVRFGSNYGPLTLAGEPWRLFTCTFIHFGVLHLAFNMWALWEVGKVVERLYGTASFTLLYLASGLAGSLASVLWNPAVNAAGASGALFGIVGALLAFLFRPDLGLPRVIVQALRKSTITFTVVSLAFGLYATGIDNAAHLGGLAGGIVMGFVLARPLVPGAGARGAHVRLAAGSAVAAVGLALAFQPVLHPSPRVAAESQFLRNLDWMAQHEGSVIDDLRALGRLGRAGRLDDAEFSRRVTIELLPRWREVERRMLGEPLPPQSRLAPLQAAVRDYVVARGRQFELLSQVPAEGDHDVVRRIREQQAVVDARAARVRELRSHR